MGGVGQDRETVLDHKTHQEQSRRRWKELRDLAFRRDPIGLGASLPSDEYDCVLGPLLTMLESSASVEEIDAYLKRELTEHFGLSPTRSRGPEHLAIEAKEWFERDWKDPHE